MGTAFEKGRILYTHRRYAMAADEFRNEISASPGSSQAHAMLGMSLLNTKDLRGAHAAVAEAIRLDPEQAYPHYAMAHVRLQYQPRRLLVLKTHRERVAFFKRIGIRKFVDARLHVDNALAISPHDVSYLHLLARLEEMEGKWGSCLEVAERGLAIRPDHRPCQILRARALAQMGRNSEALLGIDLAMASDPNDPAVHAARGWRLLRTGRAAESLEHFNESLRLDPAQKTTRRGLAKARLCARPITGWPMRMIIRFSGGRDRLLVVTILLTTGLSQIVLPEGTSPLLKLALAIGMVVYSFMACAPMGNFLATADKRERWRLSRQQSVVARVTGVWTAILLCSGVFSLCFLNQSPAPFQHATWWLALPMLVGPSLPIWLAKIAKKTAIQGIDDIQAVESAG